MFFEKTRAANVVWQSLPSMSRLNQFGLPHSRRLEVLDTFSQKPVNSGHNNTFMERILLTGIAKYTRMVEANNLSVGSKGYKPLYQEDRFKV